MSSVRISHYNLHALPFLAELRMRARSDPEPLVARPSKVQKTLVSSKAAESTEEITSAMLLRLPDDVLLEIILHTPDTSLPALFRTCKKLFQLSKEGQLMWKIRLNKNFNVPINVPTSIKDWHNAYRQESLGKWHRWIVDYIEGVSPFMKAIVITSKNIALGRSLRFPVADSEIADLWPLLRTYSRSASRVRLCNRNYLIISFPIDGVIFKKGDSMGAATLVDQDTMIIGLLLPGSQYPHEREIVDRIYLLAEAIKAEKQQ